MNVAIKFMSLEGEGWNLSKHKNLRSSDPLQKARQKVRVQNYHI